MLTAFAWLAAAQTVAIASMPPVPPDSALLAPIPDAEDEVTIASTPSDDPVLLNSVPALEGDAIPVGPNEVIRSHEVRPLPGQLNETPVFNSNSPEIIQQPGILLSTFASEGMVNAEAHLDFAFEGRFDFFAHHVARGVNTRDRRTLFLGAVVYNPSSEPVTLEVLEGVSYLSQEAPFRNLPALVSNPGGSVYAGPGSRTVTDVLQGRRQSQWPERITIPAKQAYLLMNAPIPLRRLPFAVDATVPPGTVLSEVSAVAGRQTPSNGRSALLRLSSSAPVHAATLSMYAPQVNGRERAPTLEEWLWLLVNGDLAGPRDIPPTNPEQFRKGNPIERFYYGRVAGVAQGSEWESRLTDEADSSTLTIPRPGNSLAYVISTVDHNTYGTNQVQSAPMLARYPDTAYRAHGNYGVHYKLSLPLYNDTDLPQQVELKLQTPLQDETLNSGLRFRRRPSDRVFFRGTLQLRYVTNVGLRGSRDIHVVQRQGEEGEPILELTIPPGDRRPVDLEFIYPPDATPPHVLTVTTVENPYYIEADAQTQRP